MSSRKIAILLCTVSMFVAVAGCKKQRLSPPEDWVVTHASKTLECPKDQIQFTIRVEPRYHHVSGCGKSDHLMEVCVDGVACELNSVGDLLKRASFDLGCNETELEAVRIDQETMGVTGCDQRASYKATFDGWVLNGVTEGAPAAPDSTEPATDSTEPPADAAAPEPG